MGLSPPSAKKNLGPIPTSIFEWDLFHLEAVGLIPWDLVDFTPPGIVQDSEFSSVKKICQMAPTPIKPTYKQPS